MLEKKDLRHPRTAFWEDLQTLLLKCKEEDNQIIAVGDWNRHSEVDKLGEFFDNVNMVESYKCLHKPPPDAVNNESTRAINTFWTSRSLQIRQAGYSDYGDGVCKLHRVNWIDVTFIQLLDNPFQMSLSLNSDWLNVITQKQREIQQKL